MDYRMIKRVFLNQDLRQSAYFIGSVTDNSKEYEKHAGDKDHYLYPEVDFKISDCGRNINLDFNMDKASVKKARLLADLITDFADALEAEFEAYEKWQKTLPKSRRDNQ